MSKAILIKKSLNGYWLLEVEQKAAYRLSNHCEKLDHCENDDEKRATLVNLARKHWYGEDTKMFSNVVIGMLPPLSSEMWSTYSYVAVSKE